MATAVVYGSITNALARRFVPRLFLRLGLAGIVSIAGATSESIYVSEELRYKYPRVYPELKNKGDLDLLYFLVMDYMEPFMEAIEMNRKNKSGWGILVNDLIGRL